MTKQQSLTELGRKYIVTAHRVLYQLPPSEEGDVFEVLQSYDSEKILKIAQILATADRQPSSPIYHPELSLTDVYHRSLLLLAGARAKFPELEFLAPLDEEGKPFINIDTVNLIIQTAFEYMREGRHHGRTTDSQRPARPAYGTRGFATHWMEWPSELFERRWEHEGQFSEVLKNGDNPPELAAPGDLLHLQEHHDHCATDRVIIYQITELRQGEDGDLHIEANFVARKGGSNGL